MKPAAPVTSQWRGAWRSLSLKAFVRVSGKMSLPLVDWVWIIPETDPAQVMSMASP
jgi:hypothetical protein